MCVVKEGKYRRVKKEERFYKVFGVCRLTGKLMPVRARVGAQYGPAVDEECRLIRGGKSRKSMKNRSSFQVFLRHEDATTFRDAMNSTIMRKTVEWSRYLGGNFHPYLCYIELMVKVKRGAIVAEGTVEGASTKVNGCRGAQISSGYIPYFDHKNLEEKIKSLRKE